MQKISATRVIMMAAPLCILFLRLVIFGSLSLTSIWDWAFLALLFIIEFIAIFIMKDDKEQNNMMIEKIPMGLLTVLAIFASGVLCVFGADISGLWLQVVGGIILAIVVVFVGVLKLLEDVENTNNC